MAWVRLPGKARNYVDTDTGEIISRRQYDQTIGRLAKAGIKSNEQQAAINKSLLGQEQLARPARGRKKIKETNPERRAELLKKRVEFEEQKQLGSRIKKILESQKKKVYRGQISDRMLKTGHMSRRINVPFEFDAIRDAIDSAQGTHIISYGVGINFIDPREGAIGAAWFSLGAAPMRSINDEFTEEDFEEMAIWAEEKSYILVTTAFVHFSFDINYAKKRKETAVRKARKSAF